MASSETEGDFSAMKPGNPLKHFAYAFAIALVLYALAYYAIEHRRVRNGPWQVTFTNDPSGSPELVIVQPKLFITNMQIRFLDRTSLHTNQAQTMVFDQPRPVPFNVPFGECLFMDTTFLPGTITLHLLDHEIELLPRTLVIDGRENAWFPNRAIVLGPRSKPDLSATAVQAVVSNAPVK